MRSLLAALLLLLAPSALALDEPGAPTRNPRPSLPVLSEAATPELEVTIGPATMGYIPLDRAEVDRRFQFHIYVYTPDHEGMLGFLELVLRTGQNKRFDR